MSATAGPGESGTVHFNVSWPPQRGILRGRVSLILSRDLETEPRFNVGSTFGATAQIFSYPVDDATAGSAGFPAPTQVGYPFASLDAFPSGPVVVHLVSPAAGGKPPPMEVFANTLPQPPAVAEEHEVQQLLLLRPNHHGGGTTTNGTTSPTPPQEQASTR